MNKAAAIASIVQVLHKHECAVLPGFGAFILRKNVGIANPFSGQIKPSSHTVYFNADIQEDDGLVANYLKESEGLTFIQASRQIVDFFQHIQQECVGAHSSPIQPLGNFHLSAKGDLFFLANPDTNFSKSTFGLPNYTWKWRDETIVTQKILQHGPRSATECKPLLDVFTIVDSDDKPFANKQENQNSIVLGKDSTMENSSRDSALDVSKNPQRSGLVWRVAASFTIISIGAGILLSVAEIWSVATASYKASFIPFKNPESETLSAQLHEINERIKAIESNSSPKNMAGYSPEQPTGVVGEHSVVKSKNTAHHTLRFASGKEGISAFKESLQKQKGRCNVIGGSYITTDLGLRECLLWQRIGIDACLVAVKNSILNKVIIGRFDDAKSASDFAETIKIMPTGTLSVNEIALDWNK
ncbi:MAG: hypothetical protein EXR17_02290 [Flavobacteriaceae bacterium]|nr:hypothetical protein [Flavobacteriaceae bacterium]